jgi:hypothetical protein
VRARNEDPGRCRPAANVTSDPHIAGATCWQQHSYMATGNRRPGNQCNDISRQASDRSLPVEHHGADCRRSTEDHSGLAGFGTARRAGGTYANGPTRSRNFRATPRAAGVARTPAVQRAKSKGRNWPNSARRDRLSSTPFRTVNLAESSLSPVMPWTGGELLYSGNPLYQTKQQSGQR